MGLETVIFIPLFAAGLTIAGAFFLPEEKYWALKLGLFLISFIFIFQAYNIAAVVADESYTAPILGDTLGDAAYIFGWVWIIILFVMLLQYIWDIFMMFSDKKHKTGDGMKE